MLENSNLHRWAELEILEEVRSILSKPGELTNQDRKLLMLLNRELLAREKEKECQPKVVIP